MHNPTGHPPGLTTLAEDVPLLDSLQGPGLFSRCMQLPLLWDREGRPLVEGKCPIAARGDAEFRFTKCKYPDSRYQHQKPMNLSSLRQVTRHLSPVLDVLASLNYEHRTFHEVDTPNVFDLNAMLWMLICLPVMEILDAENSAEPCRGGISPVLASAWKVSAGFLGPSEALSESALHGEPIAPHIESGQGLYEYSDKEGFLIGRGEVCAGTPGMIVACADVLLASKVEESETRSCALPYPYQEIGDRLLPQLNHRMIEIAVSGVARSALGQVDAGAAMTILDNIEQAALVDDGLVAFLAAMRDVLERGCPWPDVQAIQSEYHRAQEDRIRGAFGLTPLRWDEKSHVSGLVALDPGGAVRVASDVRYALRPNL